MDLFGGRPRRGRPFLRNSIREALDKGATPKQIRAKWGVRSPLGRREPGRLTAMTVEWIVDEWERDTGRVKANESIDHVEEM